MTAAESNIPPAIHNQQEAREARKETRDEWKVRIEAATLIFVLAYAIINFFMLRAMWKANKTTSDSFAKTLCQMKAQTTAQQQTAGAAIKSSWDAENFFRTDERAWIEIESIRLQSTITPEGMRTFFKYEVFTKNVGKTVARDIGLKRMNMMDANHGIINIRGIQMWQDKMLVDRPGIPSKVPSLPMPKSLAPNTTVTEPFILGGGAPQYGFFDYLIGRIDYKDAFDVAHWMKFCFVVTNAKGDLGICEAGNDEDSNPETKTAP